MPRLIIDWLFVRLGDGAYLTRPHGRFGSCHKVNLAQKAHLIALYRCGMEGAALMAIFDLYQEFFGGSTGYQDLYNAGGFAFGITICFLQAWLLRDAPEVTAHAYRHMESPKPKTEASVSDFPPVWVVVPMRLLASGSQIRQSIVRLFRFMQ